MKLIFIKLLIVLAALILPAAAAANTSVKTVYLYTYHNKPPFIVDLKKRTGLFFDLAEYLSQQDSQIQYRTEYIPRKRLDRLIETESLDAVVIGVNPVWFNDISKKRFLWLPSIYTDRDDFVSLSSTPFDFEGPKSFVDKRVVGVAGNYYFGINEAVEKGVLQRVDTIGEKKYSICSLVNELILVLSVVQCLLISRVSRNYLTFTICPLSPMTSFYAVLLC